MQQADSQALSEVYARQRELAAEMAAERRAMRADALRRKMAETIPARFAGAEVASGPVRGWVDAFPDVPGNLVLAGGCGTGKTMEACAAAMALMRRGVNCTFGTMEAHVRAVRAAFDGGCEADAFEALAGVTVLLVDELGKERQTEWGLALTFDLFDRRFADGRPTVVTTNLDASGLAAHLGGGDAASALVDRIYGGATVVRFAGPSRRPMPTVLDAWGGAE